MASNLKESKGPIGATPPQNFWTSENSIFLIVGLMFLVVFLVYMIIIAIRPELDKELSGKVWPALTLLIGVFTGNLSANKRR